jgi:hypothetical protein
MTDIEQGINAIRHVVQEHPDAHTELRNPIAHEGPSFFADRLGWKWPAEYLALLQRHDGLSVRDVTIFSFTEAVETFFLLRRELEPQYLWPIAPDGSGNYYAVDISRGGGSVWLLEASREFRPAPSERPPSVALWLKQRADQQCVAAGCVERRRDAAPTNSA